MKNKSTTLNNDVDSITEEFEHRGIRGIPIPDSTLEKWKDVSYTLSIEMPKYGY